MDAITVTVKMTVTENIKSQQKVHVDESQGSIAVYRLTEGSDDGKKRTTYSANIMLLLSADLYVKGWKRLSHGSARAAGIIL